jgi:hypothetical protein
MIGHRARGANPVTPQTRSVTATTPALREEQRPGRVTSRRDDAGASAGSTGRRVETYRCRPARPAAQQAQVAACCVAAAAGANVEPHPFQPTLSGMLLTGGTPRYLTARLIGGRPMSHSAQAAAT